MSHIRIKPVGYTWQWADNSGFTRCFDVRPPYPYPQVENTAPVYDVQKLIPLMERLAVTRAALIKANIAYDDKLWSFDDIIEADNWVKSNSDEENARDMARLEYTIAATTLADAIIAHQ